MILGVSGKFHNIVIIVSLYRKHSWCVTNATGVRFLVYYIFTLVLCEMIYCVFVEYRCLKVGLLYFSIQNIVTVLHFIFVVTIMYESLSSERMHSHPVKNLSSVRSNFTYNIFVKG